MARQQDKIDPPPQDYREHNSDEEISSETCRRTDSFRKPLGNKGERDMLSPLQGDASGQQRGPYKTIPRKLLRPEERKMEHIPKYDLEEDIYGHRGDNDKNRHLRDSVNHIAYSFHYALTLIGKERRKSLPRTSLRLSDPFNDRFPIRVLFDELGVYRFHCR